MMIQALARGLLLVTFFYTALPAAAQQALPAWQTTTIINFLALQTKPQCFPGSERVRSVHILGVTGEAVKIEHAAQIEILNQLLQLVSTQSGARITKADSFRFIATSGTDFSEAKVRELQTLIDGASDADVTILLRPYREVGRNVDTEIILWARGAGKDGRREIQCTPSFSVTIPVTHVDPRCDAAYQSAVEKGSLDLLQSFVAFFPDCPQVGEATSRIAELKAVEKGLQCERSLAIAQAKNTAAALTEYLETTDCPGQNSVKVLRDRLLNNERCDTNFTAAKRTNTSEGFERFIIENRDCSLQVENAQIQIQLIKTRDRQVPAPVTPSPAPQPAPVLQPQPKPRFVSPSFDCRKAGTATEFAICGNAELATLDRELSQSYASTRGRVGARDRQYLTEEQKSWIARRDSCGNDAGCIARSIRERIDELSWWSR
ncbi:lysozyme inhibitor LprI family protein [Jiella marina]|uniref:lysozyme inhibitor LprI family protein n=1 Tax=Jiella sp. LLJ827 TaxID=2917712 RepID=UPI002101C977|nr:lysozyme inhibitor LprI family protein [Jiella sp. LLJ827]MCQ0989158.1 lysozyme inhibitor LprI family protein [Jiella sp. LLJ827]